MKPPRQPRLSKAAANAVDPLPGPHVYLLRLRNGALYCGWAVDALRRLQRHRGASGSRCVRAFGPAELVYVESCPDRSAAMRREAAIKRLRRAEKLRLVAVAQDRTLAWLAWRNPTA